MREAEVQDWFVKHLLADDWEVGIESPDHGDVRATRGKFTMIAQVKGMTSDTSTDIDTGYGQLLRHMPGPGNCRFALVVPESALNAANRVTESVRTKLGVELWTVSDDGNVGCLPKTVSMPKQGDLGHPFFAYGIFKPGEIAYFQIKDFVLEHANAQIDGQLRSRDGIPILDDRVKTQQVNGHRIVFKPGTEQSAYAAIGAMEPESQYKWRVANGMNYLGGVSPNKGTPRDEVNQSYPDLHNSWSSWNDLVFRDGLELVDEVVEAVEAATYDTDGNRIGSPTPRIFFELQGAYMLLWSAIERYVSLRYGLGGSASVMSRVTMLATEEAFKNALGEVPELKARQIYRSDSPTKKVLTFDSADPDNTLKYLYQVRSNVTHRGKDMVPDWLMLHAATKELLRVFRSVLVAARRDSLDPV